jgi:hypothetical protein
MNLSIISQVQLKTFNWQDAGYKGVKPTYTQTVNILNHGGNNTNTGNNNQAFLNAIAALGNSGGEIFFPAGVYSFTSPISFNRDSITVKGAGYDSTQLRFNFSGNLSNCINISGTQSNTDTTSLAAPGIRDSASVSVLNAGQFTTGDWVYLQTNDAQYMFSSWAYGSLGQIMQIKTISGNKITFHSPFRFYYKLTLQPKITKINPRKCIGIECLKVKRMDATAGQSSIISFNRSVQCWIKGIESDSTNFGHVELNRSSNIEIKNSWFHHAFSYGGGGQAYGVIFQFSSGECLVENNIFQYLRHSMLFQAGANGNVCSYNYSREPNWTQSFFPPNSAGDIVFHGNYPFANLCEGNINQNTIIDNSHAKNGPYNTLYRNRSELYGMIMNNSPATDTVQFIGLEITNTTSPYGQFLIYGNGHLQHGNLIQGVLSPANTGSLNGTSLYLNGNQRPACFETGIHNWPLIGIPNAYNTGSIPAKDRFTTNKKAHCECTVSNTTSLQELKSQHITVFPNPAATKISFSEMVHEIIIYDMVGIKHLHLAGNLNLVDVNRLNPGTYVLKFRTDANLWSKKVLIINNRPD